MQLIPLPVETRQMTGFSHKAIINYSDLTTAGASQAFTLFPDVSYNSSALMYAGWAITKVAYRLITGFTGGALSAMTLTLGDGANATRYLAAASTDMFTAPGTTNAKDFVISGTAYVYSSNDLTNSNTKLVATFAATGANVNAATAGQVEIYFRADDLSRLSTVVEPNHVASITE
jgi:hypothetical protein